MIPGVVGISTLWHFRLPLPIQMFIKVASSPRLSWIGMPSPILWSHPLKMQRIVLLISLLLWELGTNSLITGPGEWLLFRRFTSKLSWSKSSQCWNLTFKPIHMIHILWSLPIWCKIPGKGTSLSTSRWGSQNPDNMQLIFRFCQKPKLVFWSLQMLALSKFTAGNTMRHWFPTTGKSVCWLSSVNKNQHIFRHLISCLGCTN